LHAKKLKLKLLVQTTETSVTAANYYTRLTALCPGLPGCTSTRKVKLGR